MAKTKAQLLAECAERGIEAPPKATAKEIEALLSEKRTMTVSLDGYTALNVRLAPSLFAPVVQTLPNGGVIEVESVEKGWAKTPLGFVKAEYLA